jgi:hypothetical protein
MASVYAVPASLVISCLVSAGVASHTATSEASKRQPAAVKQGGAYELKVAETQRDRRFRRELQLKQLQPRPNIERDQPRPNIERELQLKPDSRPVLPRQVWW